MVKEKIREQNATPRRGHWADRRDIPFKLFKANFDSRKKARVWINGHEVEPDQKFAHLGQRYD